jgi:hypothetical protein
MSYAPGPQPDDYEPVDLAACCNAGSDALGDEPPIAPGLRSFHGLPFLIGGERDADAASFVVVEPDGPEVVVPVGRRADHVIVAHRRLHGAPPERGPSTGDLVAEYVFDVEGRPPAAVPVRERFQIGVAPGRWDWEAPFLAVRAGATEPIDRHQGAWDEAGLRQTEIPSRSSGEEVFLWAWENPDPERVLRSVRLGSRGSTILVAAITVGHAGEDPFGRDAALPLRVSMTGRDRPCRAGELNLTVDRGVASYAYPLPNPDASAFLSDPMRGWGEAADDESRHAYARIAALPSATLTVAGPDGDLARFRWREVTSAGSAETGNVRADLVEPGRTWVHVRVVDDDSGRPVPCRVHFRSPDGIPYQPHGHHGHVNSDLGTWHVDVGGDVRLGRLTYAYIDGTCQGWLPTGEVFVDVARGFEYEPVRGPVRIEPGQRELELRLRRWSSLNERGWYSGDSHVHFLSSQGALLEQQGEDLNVVNLLQSQWGSLFTNTEDFTGRPLATPDGRYVTSVSQENRQNALGHLVLWGLREPVMPWCTGGPIEAELGGALEANESDWADRCHDQGGTVVIPHFPFPNGEPATLIATGRADAVEMIVQQPRFHEEYYGYLNCGYRLPLVGGTDKMSSDVPVGLYRTYAKLGDEEFTYDAWRRAVVEGRTFLSGGPLLTFQVDGRDIGGTVRTAGPGTVTVSATAESILPVSTLEVVQNGRVVAATSDEGARRLELTTDLRVDGDCWLAARCGGPGYFDSPAHRDVWGRGIFAHTSPVYVATGDGWELFDPAHARYMLTLIDGSLEYVRRRAPRYPRDSVTYHHGEDDHDAYLERPFLEARDLLERRLGTR